VIFMSSPPSRRFVEGADELRIGRFEFFRYAGDQPMWSLRNQHPRETHIPPGEDGIARPSIRIGLDWATGPHLD